MKSKKRVSCLIGGLVVCVLLGLTGCSILLSEFLHDHRELAKARLILSITPDEKEGREMFHLAYPGLYSVLLITVLKDGEMERYRLPHFDGRIAGRISIYGSEREYLDHSFDIGLTTTKIGTHLFDFQTSTLFPLRRYSLPVDETLTFQVEITRMDSSLADQYGTIVFSVRRVGIFLD